MKHVTHLTLKRNQHSAEIGSGLMWERLVWDINLFGSLAENMSS